MPVGTQAYARQWVAEQGEGQRLGWPCTGLKRAAGGIEPACISSEAWTGDRRPGSPPGCACVPLAGLHAAR